MFGFASWPPLTIFHFLSSEHFPSNLPPDTLPGRVPFLLCFFPSPFFSCWLWWQNPCNGTFYCKVIICDGKGFKSHCSFILSSFLFLWLSSPLTFSPSHFIFLSHIFRAHQQPAIPSAALQALEFFPSFSEAATTLNLLQELLISVQHLSSLVPQLLNLYLVCTCIV